jgi:hypothetical protein
MEEGSPYIELRLHLKEPPELFALVSAFTAIGHQFEEYIRREHPNLHGEARLYVKDIRKGSMIVELVPMILPLIENMDRVLIVDEFVRRYGGVLQGYISGRRSEQASRSDLKDFMGQVAIIATDPDASATIASATYHETKTTKRVEMTFGTQDAKRARDEIERQRISIELPAYEVHERVLMTFYQSNLGDPSVGAARTGERVIIEAIDRKPLALIYETERAKERIKHETSADERNLYRKGFLVDCFVEKQKGKRVAYRVTDVHDVIDLPDDDDPETDMPTLA